MTADREKLSEIHAKGFNCAQVVASMCHELSGIDEQSALAAMGGFGGGLRCGEVCGAVSGAVFTLGLCCPYNEDNKDTKTKITELTKECTAAFKEKFGTLSCRELLAANGKTACENYMAYAIELTHEIIERENENGNL